MQGTRGRTTHLSLVQLIHLPCYNGSGLDLVCLFLGPGTLWTFGFNSFLKMTSQVIFLNDLLRSQSTLKK